LRKPLRTGTVLQLLAEAQGDEVSYLGKPLDPRFGGREGQNAYRSTFALTALQPLGQGRGTVAAAAPERAARANLRAAEEQYQHVVSEQELQTIAAYLNVVAAQAALRLLEDSAAINRKMYEGTQALVKAGEKARSDLDRIAARVSELGERIASARL